MWCPATYIEFPFLVSVFYISVDSKSRLNSELPCAVFITVYAVNTSMYLAVSALFACLNLKRAARKTDLIMPSLAHNLPKIPK